MGRRRSDRGASRVAFPRDPSLRRSPRRPAGQRARRGRAGPADGAARATRSRPRCVRILTPGSSAPCRNGLGDDRRPLRRETRRARRLHGRARARAGVRRGPAQARPAGLRAGQRLLAARSAVPDDPLSGAAERLARQGRRAGADAAAGDARQPADRARRRRRGPHAPGVDGRPEHRDASRARR